VIAMPNDIPKNKLGEGIKLIFQNIQLLLESAKLLYENKKFLLSSSLSIFAFEEMTKAEFLMEHHKKREDASRDAWHTLTKNRKAHIKKLIGYISKEEVYKKDFGVKGETRKQKIIDDMAKYYQAIKLHVFYVNWKKVNTCENWQWFPKTWPPYYKKQIATSLLENAKRRFQDLETQQSLQS